MKSVHTSAESAQQTTAGPVKTPPAPERVTTHRPATAADAAQILRGTTGSVLFRGAGTKLGWAGRVCEPDLVIDTRQLSGLLAYNPADLTVAVRAGTTLTALQEHLAEHDQWLALDPPSADAGATIGGLLAAGESGPSRLRYGGLRDLVIGATLVLGDGTVARSGGHVIKNVAGYDLAKLVHGSLGSLALVAEVVLRLHPRPAATLTLSGPADAGQATAAALALAASPLEPAAVEWISGADGMGRLLVRSDGTPAAAEAAGRRSAELLAGLGIDVRLLAAHESLAAWDARSRACLGQEGDTLIRVAGLPSRLGSVHEHATRAAEGAGLHLGAVSSACLGLHTLQLSGGTPRAHAQVVDAVREFARIEGASVLLRRRPPEVDTFTDPLGPAPSSVALLRAIKNQFDPDGRCAPSRFRPWY